MSIFSRSNSLSQYLMKTQTSSRDQHLGSCPRPPGSWVLSWSESRGEGERGLPAPVPPPRGLKGLGYRHKNSGEKGSGGWGGGAPVPLSEIGGTFMPVKVKVKLVSVHFLYTNSLRQGPTGPSSRPRGLFIIRYWEIGKCLVSKHHSAHDGIIPSRAQPSDDVIAAALTPI